MAKVSDKSKLTKNFTVAEYAYGIYKTRITQLGEETTFYPNALLHAQILQEFRDWLGKPMTVNAWQRPSKFNSEVGGTSNSGHIFGTATDVSMKINVDTFIKYRDKWFELCKKHGCVGAIGYYDNFVHFESYVSWSNTNTYWKQVNGKLVYNFKVV